VHTPITEEKRCCGRYSDDGEEVGDGGEALDESDHEKEVGDDSEQEGGSTELCGRRSWNSASTMK
jgi:hypothetical protein